VAKLLDTMVGYDPDDPLTARGVGRRCAVDFPLPHARQIAFS